MHRDFSAPILKIDGTEFEGKQTLGSVSFMALTGALQKDRDLDGIGKHKLSKLAKRLYAGGVQEISPEEITVVKERIGLGFSIEVVGAAYDLLDADYVAPADPAAP